MTVGVSLVLAVVKAKSRARLAEIPSDFLQTDQERSLYDYVRRYVRTHNQWPSFKLLRRKFSVGKPPSEPFGYFKEEAQRRAFYNHIRDPFHQLTNSFRGADSNIEEMMHLIDQMSSVRRQFSLDNTGVEDSSTLLDAIAQEFDEASLDHGLRGVTSGWDEFDVVTGGYQASDLIIWVGRPGRGKSWLLLHQAYSAWSMGYRILYISMEMDGMQSMRRMVGLHSRVNPNLIRRGTVPTFSQDRVHNAINEMKEFQPIEMVTANFKRTIPQVRSYIEQHDPDIVYLDAAYLMKPERSRQGSSSRREVISDVVEELAELGQDAKRPIVGTVQFNRQAEQRRRGSASNRTNQNERFNPIGHLGLDVIGETDVISQSASLILGMDMVPPPFEKSMRVFGFIKGREGEDGYWYVNYPENQSAVIDLSVLSFDDPRIETIERPTVRRGSGQEVNPNLLDYMR